MANKQLENLELFKKFAEIKNPAEKKQIENQIVEKYIPLLRECALVIIQSYEMVGVEPDELIGDTYETFIKLLNRYDLSKNVSFSVYARPRITGAILDNLRRNDEIGRPARERQKRWTQTETKLTNKLSRKPTDDEIWNELAKTHNHLTQYKQISDYQPVNVLNESDDTESIYDQSDNNPLPESQIDVKEFVKTLRLKRKQKKIDAYEYDLIHAITVDNIGINELAKKTGYEIGILQYILSDIYKRIKN
jgi:RNA polymerase sigma factor for flagellar operon FliA